MLKELMEQAGHSAYTLAEAAKVSPNSVYRWMEGQRPHVGNAVDIAAVLGSAELLKHWGYAYAAKQLEETTDPDVAEGWRLDSVIAELRETNKLLRRIDNRLAQGTQE